MQFIRVGEDASSPTQTTPVLEFSEIVQFVKVGEESNPQDMPPPEFPEMVQLMSVVEELSQQLTPLPEFPEILQFVISGLSPEHTRIPPPVPLVTVRLNNLAPVRRPYSVPSITVVLCPEPTRLTLCTRSKPPDL
jgi:hypothetical protein